jgi:hypothetical protein
MTPDDLWNKERVEKVKRLIRSLYYVVKELEDEFVDENRKFTLDGHLVGSIGEVVAAYSFGLKLYPASKRTHDGEKDGTKVQVKLTGGIKGVALSSKPDHLIVLQLREFKFGIVYNGPGAAVWEKCGGDPAKSGQRPISLTMLRNLQKLVQPSELLVQERNFPDLSVNT